MSPRELVRLHLFLEAKLEVPNQPTLKLQLALIDVIPRLNDDNYPWGYWNIDLGLGIYSEAVQEKRFVPITFLQASTIVSRVETARDGPALISISCDKDGQEPEFYLQANSEAMDEAGLQTQQDLDEEDDNN